MKEQPGDTRTPLSNPRQRLAAAIIVAAVVVVLYSAISEFYGIAWGTGTWIGQLSLKWALALALFLAFCAVCLGVLAIGLLRTPVWQKLTAPLAAARESLGLARWILAGLIVVAPVWLLQYSPWGVVVDKPGLRVMLWALSAATAGFLMTGENQRLWTSAGALAAGLTTGTAFVVAEAMMDVTSYPFSLGWSEGNRLWDYSLMFAKRLYVYPVGHEPTAYLDFGRQLIGGLPFLLPNVSILDERLWLGILGIVPYFALGLLAFRQAGGHAATPWILAGAWSLMFLSQGPIHVPLVLCAILVAIAWRQPVWLAVPLVAIAGWFAEVSRFTWMFAPAIWAVMLTLCEADGAVDRIPVSRWRRALLLGIAGLLGSALGIFAGSATTGTSLSTAASASTKQPLLWYRLLPNATYGDGILLGLLLAALPSMAILFLVGIKYLKLNWIQRLVILLPIPAFLAVGLIVSTKIGGGGDLHNLDMFLIDLLFIGALVWKAGGDGLLRDLRKPTLLMGTLLALMIALPSYQPLMAVRPLSFARDATWLAVLAGVERPRDLGSLPASDVVQSSLQDLRAEISKARPEGEILFMDQRQLLTFGYIEGVSLVSDYEKKRMMDEALSGSQTYFESFYRDLASHRFSLIISSPLRTPIRDSDYGFGEENNAWVNWIAKPVLCYYQEQDTLADVKVELLVPRTDAAQCSAILP